MALELSEAEQKKQEVPKGLKIWFVAHFFIDIILAIPLIFFPTVFLSLLGFTISNKLFIRLVGAALVGIGGASLFAYSQEKPHYQALLTLKIIWSISAIIALALSIKENPLVIYSLMGIVTLFSLIWIHYKLKLSS